MAIIAAVLIGGLLRRASSLRGVRIGEARLNALKSEERTDDA